MASTPSSSHDDPSKHLHMPVKQKMALGFKSLIGGAKKLALGTSDPTTGGPATVDELFSRTEPQADGEDCSHDCDSCTIKYPRGFKVEESDLLYGHVKGWSTHLLVATSKADWVRDVEDEKGSVMQAIGKAKKPSNGVSSLLDCTLNPRVKRGSYKNLIGTTQTCTSE
jgi:hypothetical protein